MTARVAWHVRLALSMALGTLAAYRTFLTSVLDPLDPPDFQQVWFAARALLHGQDAYALIGPGRAFDFPFGFFYPLPAAVLTIPLTPLSGQWACTVFAFLGAAAFAWALMEHGYAPLLGFCSAGMVIASQEAQWSPLLASAVAIPAVGVIFAAKPTIGAAIFAARPSWWPIVGGAVLVAIAFLLQSHWVSSWLATVAVKRPAPGGSVFLVPLRLTAGPLILLALTRWRRPEARLLVALACVPQSIGLYESVPLLLIPRSWKESGLLCALSYGVLWWAMQHTGPTDLIRLTQAGRASVLLLYLPCTLMVLRRPNEGTVPAWIERVTLRWPTWLRGRAPRTALS